MISSRDILKVFAIVCLSSTTMLTAGEWVKSKESVIDTKHALQWQDNVTLEDYEEKWEMSSKHCSALMLDGHHDWRLPTKQELTWLAKSDAGKKRFSHLQKQVFWTSQEDLDDDINAFAVYIGNAHLSSNDKCEINKAICVRKHF